MDILWFQKTSLPTPWSVIENSEGEGVLLEQRFVLRRTIILNWNFERYEMWVGGGGLKLKPFHKGQSVDVSRNSLIVVMFCYQNQRLMA